MEIVGMLIVFALAGAGWWWWQHRQPKPVEDEWVLPPPEATPNLTRNISDAADDQPDPAAMPWLSGSPSGGMAGGTPSASDRPVYFDRDALVNRDKAFDPRNWDNRPDAPGTPVEEVEGDFPRFFDREYLEQRERERGGEEA